ncbi:MAG: RagB/SusD family nutrient uptake outer membrane protein [Bacteroidales bacterium]|nr:RagB/SusD family nutrient uptake outer membrane protein [Bacteroidales bacterium]
MKRYIFILLIIVGTISACTEKLDVIPTDSQNIEEALSTSDGLKSLRNSSYAYARRNYTRYMFHFAEMLADTGEIWFTGTYEELEDLQNKSLVPTFMWGEYAWRYSYRAINGCNLILENLDIVEDDVTRSQLEGDARFLRGILHFDLTRFFGLPYGTGAMNSPAVPLATDGVMSADDLTYPSRATVGEVFTQVEADLLAAADLLPVDETFFANRYAAMAMLSRYYLTIGNFEQAAAMADSVIESGMYALVGDVFYAYNQSVNSTEDIMTWAQSELDNEGANNDGMTPFFASTNANGRSEMVITEEFLAATYDAEDARGIVQYGLTSHSEVNTMYYEGFGQRARGIYSAKWLEYNTNVTFIRLAEMYLTRAEANQILLDQGASQVGTNSPVDDINVIRERAGLVDVGSVTLDDIRFERYRELIFEGHRLHDYKRWQRSIGNLEWNSEDLIIPLPKAETDANPNL